MRKNTFPMFFLVARFGGDLVGLERIIRRKRRLVRFQALVHVMTLEPVVMIGIPVLMIAILVVMMLVCVMIVLIPVVLILVCVVMMLVPVVRLEDGEV
jgi:uncharacterized membrane protein